MAGQPDPSHLTYPEIRVFNKKAEKRENQWQTSHPEKAGYFWGVLAVEKADVEEQPSPK